MRRGKRLNTIKQIAATLAYVTIFPLPRWTHADAQGNPIYLPLAGALIGLVVVLVAVGLFYLKTSGLLAAVLLIGLWLFLTGGLHLDGLMDATDGIASHRSRERMLEIMQDSRVGNFEVMAGIFVILIKIAALFSLFERTLPLSILSLAVVPIQARLMEALVIGSFPYARPEGMGRAWHQAARRPHPIVTSLAAAIVSIASISGMCALAHLAFALPVAPALIALACTTSGAALTALITALLVQARLGGHTGDTYGMIVELSECGALTTLALAKDFISL